MDILLLQHNKAAYRRLCAEEPSIRLYLQAWWLDATAGPEDWDVVLARDKQGEIIGSFVLYITRWRLMRGLVNPPFCQYSALWLRTRDFSSEQKRLTYEKQLMNELLQQVEVYARWQRIDFAKFSLSPTISNWLPFYWRGYRAMTRYTYVTSLEEPNKTFAAFDRSKQRNIRSARNVVEPCVLSPEEFYDHHARTLRREGKRISYSKGLFMQMYRAGAAEGKARIFALREPGMGPLHAALFVPSDAHAAYDLISTIDPDLRASGASAWVVQLAMEYYAGKVGIFDFEGSMIEGVEESFRRFGGRQVPYFQLTKIYTRNLFSQALLRWMLF